MTIIQSRSAFKHFASTVMRRVGPIDIEACLPEGLSLGFRRMPDGCRQQWKMVLAREDYAPTADEVEACCLAFHVPPWASERRLSRYKLHPRSGRRIHYHTVELTWHEEDEAAQRHENSLAE